LPKPISIIYIYLNDSVNKSMFGGGGKCQEAVYVDSPRRLGLKLLLF
jgi:hypothetical protein